MLPVVEMSLDDGVEDKMGGDEDDDDKDTEDTRDKSDRDDWRKECIAAKGEDDNGKMKVTKVRQVAQDMRGIPGETDTLGAVNTRAAIK